jgi:hypothetical protein
MVRRRFPSGFSTSTTSRAAAFADADDLDPGQVERCQAVGKASRESSTAWRRAATMGDGLICSRTQTASIALRFFDALLIETELQK